MTRGSFFASVVWSSCLMAVPSLVSVLTLEGCSCLSGEGSLGVDFPLAPPSCFLSRSFIVRTGAGWTYFGTDFPPPIVSSNAMARSSQGGRGAGFDCLPPRRFLMPLSTYRHAIQFLRLTANARSPTSFKISGAHQSRAIWASTLANPVTWAMVPLMSALSLYPPVQRGQLMRWVIKRESTFENTDDPPASYSVRKRTCIPRKSVIKFHRDPAPVSRHGLVLVFARIEPTAAGSIL